MIYVVQTIICLVPTFKYIRLVIKSWSKYFVFTFRSFLIC